MNAKNFVKFYAIKVIKIISQFNSAISIMAPNLLSTQLPIMIVISLLISPTIADLQAGFSQGCYSACPRKIWTLENNNSREQVDRQWIECLKECHQVDSWKFIIIVCAIVIVIAFVCILIYICWGEKIRLKYTFHVQRKKRSAISTDDETKVKVFQQGLKKFKQIVMDQVNQICIEFENDEEQKKTYLIQDSIFHQRKQNQLENMFSIILHSKKQSITITPQKQKIIEDHSELQIQNNSTVEEEEYSQLIGAITLTNKGMNLWWIKIDQKPEDERAWCRWCSRKDKKYFAVYEKDPFASDGNFIGNVVLQDSSKKAQERYTKYTIKRKQVSGPMHIEDVTIQT